MAVALFSRRIKSLILRVKLVFGIEHAPRKAIRRENLKWELSIGMTTGLLITETDQPAVKRIQSKSFQNLAGRWSDAGLIRDKLLEVRVIFGRSRSFPSGHLRQALHLFPPSRHYLSDIPVDSALGSSLGRLSYNIETCSETDFSRRVCACLHLLGVPS